MPCESFSCITWIYLLYFYQSFVNPYSFGLAKNLDIWVIQHIVLTSIFWTSDLLAGHLIQQILVLRGIDDFTSIKCTALWLFNPFTFTIATRGNCEAMVCCIILRIILCLLKGTSSTWNFDFMKCFADIFLDINTRLLQKSVLKCHVNRRN